MSSSLSSTTAGNYKKNKQVNGGSSAASATSCNPLSRDSIEEGTSSDAAASSSARPACAACKHQRRKCAANCLLAPYFPAHLQQQFQNAHHLYGVKNITRIVRGLDPVRRDNAMYSIIYESNARASDRVGGCLGILCELQRRLQRESSELALVFQHLAICRAEASALQASPPALDSSTSVGPGGDDGNLVNVDMEDGHEDATRASQRQQYCYGYFCDGDRDTDNVNVACNTKIYNNNNSNSGIDNCNANIGDRDHGVVLRMQVQAAMRTLNLQQQQQQQQRQRQEEEEDDDDELESGDLAHDVFDVIEQPFHERDSSDHADATAGESYPCTLGLGLA